jgi:hypothetical protein
VFYTCLAGHPPFHGKTSTELFRKIAAGSHTPLWRLLPGLDPELANLVETLLRKHAGDRGGGPRWLHRRLKGYLMALGVMDPAELIAGCLRDLSARGVQTTWRMDAPDPLRRAATLAAGEGMPGTLAFTRRSTGTLPAEPYGAGGGFPERFTRESASRKPFAVLAAALGILAVAGAGARWGYLRVTDRPSPDRRAHLESSSGERTSAADGNSVAESDPAYDPGSSHPGSERRASRGPASESLASDGSSGGAADGMSQSYGRKGRSGFSTAGVSAAGVSAAGADSGPQGDRMAGTASDPAALPGPGKADSAGAAAAGIPGEGMLRKRRDEMSVLVLHSSPPFAEAYVDGRYVGVTPVRVETVSGGRHRVALKLKRLPAFDTVLAAGPGTREYKFRLDRSDPSRLAATPEEP